MSDRSNFQAMLRKSTVEWSKKLLEAAKKNAPRHLAPHIYVTTPSISKERFSINIGVRRIDSFESSSRIPGAVSGGGKGTLDARAQEYGSGTKAEGGGTEYIIKPRKRNTIRNKPLVKYTKEYRKNKSWLGVGMAYQRSWLALPNKFTAKGTFKPSMSQDGYTIFVQEVEHPGINKYRGRGYLRISIRENMELMREGASMAVRKAVISVIRDGLLSKGTKQVFQP